MVGAGKGVEKGGRISGRAPDHGGKGLRKAAERADQDAVLQKLFYIFLLLPKVGFGLLFNRGIFADEKHPRLHIIHQRTGRIVNQGEIAVERIEGEPFVKLFRIRPQMLRRLFVFGFAGQGADGVCKLLYGIRQHFVHRSDQHLIRRIGAPLGLNIKKGERVDLVAPKLHPDGPGAARRENIGDPAANGKLRRPFDLRPVLIPGTYQLCGQRL